MVGNFFYDIVQFDKNPELDLFLNYTQMKTGKIKLNIEYFKNQLSSRKNVIKQYRNGYYWQKLKSNQELIDEGKRMSHCLGKSYKVGFNKGFYSLRNIHGESLITIMTEMSLIKLISSYKNDPIPIEEYQYVLDFIKIKDILAPIGYKNIKLFCVLNILSIIFYLTFSLMIFMHWRLMLESNFGFLVQMTMNYLAPVTSLYFSYYSIKRTLDSIDNLVMYKIYLKKLRNI